VYTEIDMDLINKNKINENEENNGETKTSDNREYKKKRNTKKMGVSILKKTIAPELRTNKKLKKMHEVINAWHFRTRLRHKGRNSQNKNILKKELEFKENQFFAEFEINAERLKAVKVENEIRVLQKQIKEAKLEKLLKDWLQFKFITSSIAKKRKFKDWLIYSNLLIKN